MKNLIVAPAGLDLSWIALCTVLVFLMQAGFCLIESGMVRTKNSIKVAVKNLLGTIISMLAFTTFGFSLMFGADVVGLIGIPDSVNFYSDPHMVSFFLSQIVFCSTAPTIISGAIAERTRLGTFLVIAVCVSGIVYPIAGHWIWGGTLIGTNSGWLRSLGFVDFAGGTAVHVVGGFASLAAVIAVGPRRFIPDSSRTGGHSLTLAVQGCILLWFGWWGFNGGACLAATAQLPIVLLNTQLGAAAGGSCATLICLLHKKRIEVVPLICGIIAGLVSVTAACHSLTPHGAMIVAIIGAALAYSADVWMKARGIDDVVSAFPVHGVAGIWGTVAFSLFGGKEFLNGTSRLQSFTVQAAGSILVAAA